MKEGIIAERGQIRSLILAIIDRIDEVEIIDLETVVDEAKTSLSDFLERCKLERQTIETN